MKVFLGDLLIETNAIEQVKRLTRNRYIFVLFLVLK